MREVLINKVYHHFKGHDYTNKYPSVKQKFRFELKNEGGNENG